MESHRKNSIFVERERERERERESSSSNLKTFFSKSLKSLNNNKLNLKSYFPKFLKSLNNKAFSLIELLIVITIIGILVAVGSSSYNKYKTKSYHSVAKNRLRSMGNTIRTNQALGLETTKAELAEFRVNGKKAHINCVNAKDAGLSVWDVISKDEDIKWAVRYGISGRDCGIGIGVRSCLDSEGNMFYNIQNITGRGECVKGPTGEPL